jgi:hypothetical protein
MGIVNEYEILRLAQTLAIEEGGHYFDGALGHNLQRPPSAAYEHAT